MTAAGSRAWGAVWITLFVAVSAAVRVDWLETNRYAVFLADEGAVFRHSRIALDWFGGGVNPLVSPAPAFAAPYPPLVPLVGAIHAWVTGDASVRGGAIGQWPFWIAGELAVGLALLWRRGLAAGLAGAAATVLLGLDPDVRTGMFTDPAAGSLVAVGVVALAGASGSVSPARFLVAGAAAGAALLAKWTAAWFLGPVAVGVLVVEGAGGFRGGARVGVGGAILLGGAGAVLVAAGLEPGRVLAAGAGLLLLSVGWGWRAADRPARRLALLLLFVTGAGVVAGPWYHANLPTLRRFFEANVAVEYAGGDIDLLDRLRVYPHVLFFDTLGVPLLVLAGLGAARQLFRGRSALGVLALLAFFTGLAALSASPYQAKRYLLAGFPLLGLLVGEAAAWVPPARGFVAGAVALGTTVFLASGTSTNLGGWIRWAAGRPEAQAWGIGVAAPPWPEVRHAPPRHAEMWCVRRRSGWIDLADHAPRTRPAGAFSVLERVVPNLPGRVLRVGAATPGRVALEAELIARVGATAQLVPWPGGPPFGVDDRLLLGASGQSVLPPPDGLREVDAWVQEDADEAPTRWALYAL